jgi:hypothetical protein
VAVIAEPELPPEPEPKPERELPKTHIDKDGILSFMEGYRNSRYPYTLNNVAFVCSGYGCQHVNKFKFPDLLVSQLQDLFVSVDGPKTERAALAKAIGLIEKTAGPLTGTSQDRPSIDFGGSGDPSQLDCSDESINATSYMVILYKLGLINYHSIERPNWKGGIFKMTHQAAVITDETTGTQFAVDSGIGRNGAEPLIVPYDEWYE